MSNQYIPKNKTDKVFTSCTLSSGTFQNKTQCSALIDPFVSYTEWEQYDADFTIFKNVRLSVSLDEVTYTERLSVPATEIPHGSNVISKYKRTVNNATPTASNATKENGNRNATGPETDQIPKFDQTEINATARNLVLTRGIPYDKAFPMAIDILKQRAANQPPTTTQKSTTTVSPTTTPITSQGNDGAPKTVEVEMADVDVTRTVGPFLSSARFDHMMFNMLTKEGIFHRKNSGKYYTVSFDISAGRRKPVILRECAKSVTPAYFLS